MLQNRIIPGLLLDGNSLVKTINFKKSKYIGDPINTIRIFNELEVDEVVLLDITATRLKKSPNFKLITELTNECFMPLAYGGGIRHIDDAKKLFNIGIEKVIINSFLFEKPSFITQLAKNFGSQSVVASIDIKKNLFGNYQILSNAGKKKQKVNIMNWVKELENLGAGELLITAIHKEGTWSGFDFDLVEKISNSVNIPVIAHGGASSLSDIEQVIKKSNASAACLGSMVVYQRKGMGVLINFPEQSDVYDRLHKH